MAVTVSDVPIKVYITNQETNTAHPIGGVLTQEQNEKLNSASETVKDALLKNSDETQVVVSNTQFENPVLGVNSVNEETGKPSSTAEFVTYGTLTCELSPINEAVAKLDQYPDPTDIARVNVTNVFTAEQVFNQGLSTPSIENPQSAPDTSILNKSDVMLLLDNYGNVKANVNIVTELPPEDEMEEGHIYVELCPCSDTAIDPDGGA